MQVDNLVFDVVKFGTDPTCATIAVIPPGKPSVCLLCRCRLGCGHGGRRDVHRIEKTGTGEKDGYK